MDTKDKNENIVEKLGSGMVHFLLSHSYFVFLLAVILGAIAHTFFTIELFTSSVSSEIGFIMIVLGTALIYWAQSTSSSISHLKPHERTEQDFERGPYKYSRNPTHVGLSIMTLGFGFILNSFFTVVFIIIASFITKFIFIRKEEKILENEYGQTYCNYKKKVKTWV